MAKLGLPRHRYAVGVLCWFYVIISMLAQVYFLLEGFSGSIFVLSLINLAIGCFGLFALYKENGTLMKIFGIILVVAIIIQILEILGMLILTVYREAILNEFLRALMDKYYDSSDEREIIDDIQEKFECCGRRSYKDWAIQPFSCCKTIDCSTYYANGCVDALSSIVVYTVLLYGLIAVGSIIVHIYTVVSSFELARVYRRGPVLPSIKHGFANF